VKIYTEIERLMFPYIHIQYDVEDDCFMLPTLTVQPLVENAIRHGVRAREVGLIKITVRKSENEHIITIADNGLGFDPAAIDATEGKHIGIRNVRERLEKQCGGSLKIESRPGEGTTVTLLIPEAARNDEKNESGRSRLMKALCVDDALPIMEDTVAMCKKLPEITSVTGFTRPREAMEWLENNPVDLALLDIDMPEINGLMLAEQVKRKYPDAAVIFLTAFPQYAVQAIKLRTSGYLLKPVSLEDLKEEVAYAHSQKPRRSKGHIVVQTFGNFEIFVDGETLVFHRQKAKELLAYLIDRGGRGG